MKCEFSSAGVLRIIPESPVEQFALSKWDRSQIEISKCDWDVKTLEELEAFATLVKGSGDRYQEWLRLRDSPVPQEAPK